MNEARTWAAVVVVLICLTGCNAIQGAVKDVEDAASVFATGSPDGDQPEPSLVASIPSIVEPFVPDWAKAVMAGLGVLAGGGVVTTARQKSRRKAAEAQTEAVLKIASANPEAPKTT